MNLEKQCTSLELSMRLKELGVKQSSLFWHWISKKEFTGSENHSLNDKIPHNEFSKEIDPRFDYFSAFTSSELGEMLPKFVSINTEDEEKKLFCNFKFVMTRGVIIEENNPIQIWSLNYICDTTNELRNWFFYPLLTKSIYDVNEANARAKMLIHLIENKYIEIEK